MSDKIAAIGTQAAQPSSGSITLIANEVQYPFFKMRFVFNLARINITDAAASGSSGSLKLFTFKEGVIGMMGSRHDWTAGVTSSAVDTGAGDAAYVVGFGTAAADAGDGALTGTEVNFGATRSITNSGGTGTGATTITGAATPIDGTATALDLYLNWSGTAATVDANGTIDMSGTFDVVGFFLGDD